MKKYRVISLSVSGMNNKIHRLGDIVTSAHFPDGNAEKLEKDGFLKEFTKSEYTKVEKLEKAAKKLAEKEAKEKEEKLQEIIVEEEIKEEEGKK